MKRLNKIAITEAVAAITLIIIILSSCAQHAPIPQTYTQTSTLTVTRTPEYSTQVYSYPLVLTSTAKSESTQNPEPTMNSTIEAAFSSIAATEEAWSYTAVPATQSLKATQITSFRVSCEPSSTLESPNENWLAVTCQSDPMDFTQGMELLVFDRYGNTKYKIIRKDIHNYPPDKPVELGEVSPLHWSNDSQILYFTLEDYVGDAVVMDSRGPLYRLNIATGLYSQMTGSDFNHYSFSPTDRRLLSIDESDSPLTISILDLKTGKRNEILVPDVYQGGDSLWSPDGTKVVFVTSNDFILSNYSVILVDVVNLTHRIIISGLYDYFTPFSWSDDNIIQINARKYEPIYNVYVPYTLSYNVVSGELTGIISTP